MSGVNSKEFKLFETIRLENGEYQLLDKHLKRLANSAGVLEFAISIDKIKKLLDEHTNNHFDNPQRVRLYLSRNGEVTLESEPLLLLNDAPKPVVLSKAPVDSDNFLLYHKTTNRIIYEERRSQRSDIFDVLLQNEKNQLTEFTIGNVVLRIDNLLLTPAEECGLLPGTMRASLLENGTIKEEILTCEQLHKATSIWLINSLRGCVPVYLKESF